MLKRFYTSAFLLAFCCLSGCLKEYSREGGPPIGPDITIPSEPVVQKEWEFKDAATHFHGPVDTAYLTQEDQHAVLTVTGSTADGSEKLLLLIKGSGKIEQGKTYNTTQESVKFLYTATDTLYSAIPYYGGDIYVTITAIDEEKVTGTFKGLAAREGRSYAITDGRFSSPLKKVMPSATSGFAMLWAEEGCNGPIDVKVNNKAGTISRFTLVTPNCGDPGTATFQLPPGVHNWVAYCGRDSVGGQVTVKGGSCAKIAVRFPFKPPPQTVTSQEKECQLSTVQYGGCFLFCEDRTRPNTVSSIFNGTRIDSLYYYISPAPVLLPQAVVYAGNRIIIGSNPYRLQEFVVDLKGRVIEYAGYEDPASMSSKRKVFVTYRYDNDNNLVKRRYQNEQRETLVETDFTWQNGNLAKATNHFTKAGGTEEIFYEYYTDKPVRSMPFIHYQATELLLFQPLLNWGNHTRNPPKKVTYLSGSASVHTFDQYVIDDNDYVLSLRQADKYGQHSTFSFNYTCF